MTADERRADALQADGVTKAPTWLWLMLGAAVVAGVAAAVLSFASVSQGRVAQRGDILRNRIELLRGEEHTLEHRIRSEESRTCLLDYMRGITEYSTQRRPLSEVPIPAVCQAQDVGELRDDLADVRRQLNRLIKENDQ